MMQLELLLIFCVSVTMGDYTFQKLDVNGAAFTFETPDYPGAAAPNYDMEYSLRSTDPSGRVQLNCTDIRLKKASPCSDDILEIIDAGVSEKLCGDVGRFETESSGSKLSVKLKTGKQGGGGVQCTARAVPNPIDAFLNFESEEQDSTEAGIGPGAKSTTCPCGNTNKGSGRIVGGKETQPNQYPFVVGMVNVDVMFLFCGASIITKKHAITAAHCTFTRTDKRKLGIIMGFHNTVSASVKYNREGEISKISQIIEHKEYSPQTLNHDIALLVLAEEIQYTVNIQPVCMPTGRTDVVGKYLRVLGWGKVGTNLGVSEVLRTVNLKVIPIEVCADKFMNVPTDKPKQICTFGHGKDSCVGDSGGPLVWLDPETNRYTLIALVSYGKKECAGENPGLNTDVAAYLDWINQHIRETSSHARTCSKQN